MIQIENLSIGYLGNPLFSGCSFNLQEGEKCGLVGRNGSGKSTLFRLLINEEIPDLGTITVRKNYSIGLLNQHIRFQKQTLLEEAALGLPNGEKECLYKAEKILFGLGFKKDDLDRSIQDFSGGYQLRLHLAKVLIAEPNCLLLDEPTNYLDIVSIRWFTRFLQQWSGEFILISHDREFMDSVTNTTMGIHRQKIRKLKGDTVFFYEQIVLEEEIHEKTRQKNERIRAQGEAFIKRFGAKATKAAQAQSKRKKLEKIPVLEKLKEINQLDFHFNEAFFPGRKMLDLKNGSFSYTEQSLITDLNLSIENGERIGVIGKNGRGKSTILRLIANELNLQNGERICSDQLSIGYFGQTNIDRLNPKATVEEEISSANPLLNKTEVKAICGLMMFSGDLASKPTALLSGGEKSRVLLGKILAKPCNLVLLDEPTHHLDMESIEALIDALEEFNGAVVVITHSELLLKRLQLDKILVCHERRQELFLGDYEEFLEKDGWEDSEKLIEEKPKKTEKHQSETCIQGRIQKQIEKEILRKEASISSLEKELGIIQNSLIEIINEKNSKKAAELGVILTDKQKGLDQLYTELEQLLNKLNQ